MKLQRKRHLGLLFLVFLMVSILASSTVYGVSSIWDSAYKGDLKSVKLQIEKIGTDVNALDNMGNTPIVYAIAGGQPKVVEYLLEKGADLKLKNSFSGSFFDGLESNKLNVLQYAAIVWRNCRTTFNKRGGNNNLGVAHTIPLLENAQVIRVISDANKKMGLKLTPPSIDDIDMAVILGDLDAVKRFVKLGSGVTGFTFRFCVAFDDVKILEYFDSIEYISDPQTGSYEELTINAVEHKSYQCLNYLFESGKSPNGEVKIFGLTPLSSAARMGDIDMFQYLLDKGANINQPAAFGWNVLHTAAAQGNIELAKLILSKGVKVDVKDEIKQTPLHYAAANGHLEMVKFLIANGADPVAHGNSSMPYDLAVQNKHDDVAAFLKPYADEYYKKFN